MPGCPRAVPLPTTLSRRPVALCQSAEDALPHWELAKKYDLIDFELGVKITGAGFPVYKGKGARLQRALISFFLDAAREAGYLEIQPPYVVNAASGYGTGQLPTKRVRCTTATRTTST